ncbi:MAG: antibiotic biosynthesis monooxygenase [Oscillatoria sp. Prado101]|jgi:quinol monooxygenase YgiN|nr:antibiotic biosynthesis monooxygenase [Oscillatoria sp. Prado101]
MFAIFVKFTADSEARDTLIKALVEDGEGSLKDEPDTRRFDVIQDASNPNVLFLYEVYKDEAAFQEHTQREPYQKFMEVLQGLISANRCKAEELGRGTSLFPPSDSQAWQKQ